MRSDEWLNRHGAVAIWAETAQSLLTPGMKLKQKLDNGQVLTVPGRTVFWHGLAGPIRGVVISATTRLFADRASAGAFVATTNDIAPMTSAISAAMLLRNLPGDDMAFAFIASCLQRVRQERKSCAPARRLAQATSL